MNLDVLLDEVRDVCNKSLFREWLESLEVNFVIKDVSVMMTRGPK